MLHFPSSMTFLIKSKKKAEGQKATRKVSAGDALIKVVQDELALILGNEGKPAELNLKASPPVVILMVGLQGSGKTTSAGKLAKMLKNKQDKKVAMVSTDIYRPAAIDQLQTLCLENDVTFISSTSKEKPTHIAKNALKEATKSMMDVLIVDTAGRLHIDKALMKELHAISDIVKPTETLLVVDSMTGQDAAHIAKDFNDQLALTGTILTKTDGDARGGAALSMSMITGKPIKFIGTGEKQDNLETFHPKRLASRILGMGDIVSLVEKAQDEFDEKKTKKLAKKAHKNTAIFDFNDMLAMIEQTKRLGNTADIMKKLPMAGAMKGPMAMFEEGSVKVMRAVIGSMTTHERAFPAVINGSRKRRLSKGSGVDLQQVARTIRNREKMKKMFKQASSQKLRRRMNHLQANMPNAGPLDDIPFDELDH